MPFYVCMVEFSLVSVSVGLFILVGSFYVTGDLRISMTKRNFFSVTLTVCCLFCMYAAFYEYFCLRRFGLDEQQYLSTSPAGCQDQQPLA